MVNPDPREKFPVVEDDVAVCVVLYRTLLAPPIKLFKSAQSDDVAVEGSGP